MIGMNGRIGALLGAGVVLAGVSTLALAIAAEPALKAGQIAEPEAMVQIAQAVDQATLAREGGPLFTGNCAPCHGNQGQGDMGPKLAAGASDIVKEKGALIAQILQGAEGHGMPPFADALKDRQIAAIATYVRNTWGNTFGVVTPTDVAGAR